MNGLDIVFGTIVAITILLFREPKPLSLSLYAVHVCSYSINGIIQYGVHLDLVIR